MLGMEKYVLQPGNSMVASTKTFKPIQSDLTNPETLSHSQIHNFLAYGFCAMKSLVYLQRTNVCLSDVCPP